LTQEIENFNLKYLYDIFVKNSFRIFLFSILLSIISIGFSFFFEKNYKSDATIIASSSDSQSSGLDGVSSLLGIGGSSDRRVIEAIAILQSRDFISNFLFKYGLVNYVLKDSNLDLTNLTASMNNSSREDFDKSEIDGLTGKFKKKFISIDQSDQDGLIVLSLSTRRAEDSQIILGLIIEELELIMKSRFLKDKQNSIFSLEKILSEGTDTNTKKIVESIYQSERRSLISGTIKSNLVFDVIDAPHLPGSFYYPSRLRFLIFGFILGLLLSYLYFFRKKINS
tara:strand:+ start:3933 stop:4778 length:846 start_codon:yes stop_codon:yes gene_type:complete